MQMPLQGLKRKGGRERRGRESETVTHKVKEPKRDREKEKVIATGREREG